MIKISGLEQLSKKMDQLTKFSEEIDGEFANVSFNPNDPSSIEAAISEMEMAVDAKASSYERNDMIADLVLQIKESFRSQILEQAAQARLEPVPKVLSSWGDRDSKGLLKPVWSARCGPQPLADSIVAQDYDTKQI